MAGDIEFLVATVKDIQRQMQANGDARLDAFTGLLSSVETGLAELIENIEKGGGAQAIEAMANALRDIKMPEVTVNVSPTPIEVKVPEQKTPTVNVQVHPTPVTVEAVMPEQPTPVVHNNITLPDPSGKWKITIPGVGYNAQDRVGYIEKVK